MTQLTAVEQLVLDEFLRTGASDKELARQLFRAHGTIKVHMTNIREKFGVETRSQLLIAARQLTPEVKVKMDQVKTICPNCGCDFTVFEKRPHPELLDRSRG